MNPEIETFEVSQESAVKSARILPVVQHLLYVVLTLMVAAFMLVSPAFGQTAGEGGIQGTVVDATGAAVPGATVTATNVATGVATMRVASGDGLYTISPVIPGTYTVSVKAKGFQETTQKNLVVDALRITGLNLTLNIGSESTEVTVSEAPPALETTNATLGGVMENQTYENLPLQMSGQQRDPTSFATLLPGTQSGARAPIIGGTGNYLAAVYVDGVPVTTINQQGDNRVVSNALPVESIDQFQVITSAPDAEYQGAGLINFTLKSGGSDYHGLIAGFVRARAFDTWNFASKANVVTNASGNLVPASPKPDEHQSEFVASGGGPIPFTRKKGFFYVSYDKFHGRTGINPQTLTVPTTLMRQGNFSELLSQKVPVPIYDPRTNAACSAGLCRTQYMNNVIPTDQLSPIALKMQSYLPPVSNANLVNNYIGGVPSGYDNWEIAGRADFDLTPKQRLSYVIAYGVRRNVPFTVGGTPAGVVLPIPYTAGGIATITPVITDVEHAWQISQHITNQFKFGFNRFGQPITSLTDGVSPYRASADIGITNLPAGQASTEFPGATFATSTIAPTAISPWTSNGASGATQTTVPNTYTLLDNFLITRGRHNITIGATTQWLQDNVASQLGNSGIYTVPYSPTSTSTFNGTQLSSATSGYSYASYLLGAASSSGIAIQAVAETGGRYHDISPYVEDNWKITPKLTVDLGLRWDYFPPFHEVQDRWSFLNPNLTNGITGNPGELQFAGNHGGAGVSCNCRTPVQTWWKNYGPRFGLAYSVTPTTVLRAGYALVYSIGGGVGGRGGAGTGTGQAGFNVTATAPSDTTTGINAGPSYFLNNSSTFTTAGVANTAFGGPGYVLPTPTTPSASTQTLNTGNYVNSAGAFVTASTTAYADPYLSGRAPEFAMYNAGIQQALTNSLTLTLNYAGTQSHFLAASGTNGRGYWAGQLDPKYLVALGGVADSTGKAPLLSAIASPANVAIAQANLPGYKLPYGSISAANTKASIAQTLLAFPQYSGVSDTWGNVANISYNSLQASLSQRPWHGLSYTVNYTWSKNMGDEGTYRSGYDLPSGSVSGSTQSYKANRIDRSLTITDTPQNIAAYGVWELPFGKGHIGGDSFLVRTLAGGWQVSSIYRFSSGVPFVVTYGGCVSPNAGTCSVDLNPNFTGNPRQNGGMRREGVSYINPNAFKAPATFTNTGIAAANQITMIGNAPRTAPYGLRQPYFWQDDVSLRRSFNITPNRLKFIAEFDCLNVANHATLTNLTAAWGAPNTATGNAFGTLTGAQANQRDFQFAGRVTF
jgi:hypothetical protein